MVIASNDQGFSIESRGDQPLPSKTQGGSPVLDGSDNDSQKRKKYIDDGIGNHSFDAMLPDNEEDAIDPADIDPNDDEDFKGSLTINYNDARQYIDDWIAPQRVKAMRYYQGQPFGNEVVGRSQFIMTVVRDKILQAIPQTVRVLAGSEKVVEFQANNKNTEAMARQMTDYINHVFMVDNKGTTILNSVLLDAYLGGLGIVKWRWSKDFEVKEERHSGKTAEQIAIYFKDTPYQKLTNLKEDPVSEYLPVIDPLTGQPLPPPPKTYSFKLRIKKPKNQLIIESVPPEEFIYSRDAPDLERAVLCAHRRNMYISDVVAMGYPLELIEQYRGMDDVAQMAMERQARNPADYSQSVNTPDISMQRVWFMEVYLRADRDGDGVAELHKIHCIGDTLHILSDEIVSEAPFALFCPMPTAHMIMGEGIADQTMDLQLLYSNIMRNGLDAFAGSVHPRTVVTAGKINLADAQNRAQGAVVRTLPGGTPADIQELRTTFDGQSLIGMLGFLEQVIAKRTGVSDASQGLDPNVLQGSSTEGVVATITGAQDRIEYYCRIFAEQGMQRLFKGVARALNEHQDFVREMQLNGEYVQVDPRDWATDLDVTVNVALGKGTEQQKLQSMGLIVGKQENIMQTAGVNNPIVSPVEYTAALGQTVNLMGMKNSSKFFKPISETEWKQFQAQQQQQQPPPPNPQMEAVKLQQQENVLHNQLEQQKFQWEQLKDIADIQFKREKEILDAKVALVKVYLDHGREADANAMDSLVDHANNQASQQIEVLQAAMSHHQAMNPPVDPNQTLQTGLQHVQAMNGPPQGAAQ